MPLPAAVPRGHRLHGPIRRGASSASPAPALCQSTKVHQHLAGQVARLGLVPNESQRWEKGEGLRQNPGLTGLCLGLQDDAP